MPVIKISFFVGLLWLCQSSFANPLEQAEKTENHTQKLAQKSQQEVNKLDNQTKLLLQEYQKLMQQSDYQKVYNQELSAQLLEQEKTIKELKQQLSDVQITKLHIMPFLREKAEDLKQFIKLDLPFQQDQRLALVDRLQALISDSSADIAEKYRRLMEAWQAESDFSYELNTYRGNVAFNGQLLSVNFLQVGRLALFFQTLDGEQSAYWQTDKKQWQALDNHYNHAIKTAMGIASKQSPPQLLPLPIKVQEL